MSNHGSDYVKELEVKMDGFVLKGKKFSYKSKQNVDSVTVRLTPEAYNALVDMANESTLSIRNIASQAILYAYSNLEIDREESGKG